MAMGAFDRDDLHDAPMADINITPMVDVMLVMLVIFLVTAPMLSHAVKLQLPRATAAAVKDPKPAVLSLDSGGQYYWDDAPVTESELRQHIQEAAAGSGRPLHIRADEAAAYGKVNHALALAARFGLTNIGFLTQPDSRP